jgi:ABC-type glycerol-3-phosphate transport system substrate-binding protein
MSNSLITVLPSVLSHFSSQRRLIGVGLLVAICSGFGCTPPVKPAAEAPAKVAAAPETLEVLVVGDPQVAGQVARSWQAEGGGEARVSELSLEDWSKSDFAVEPKVDVVVFPSELQSDVLGKEPFLELPTNLWNGTEINKAELLSHFRTDLAKYRNKYFVVPLGAPQLLLIYRADVLVALQVEPPKTWNELDSLVAKLAELPELKSSGGDMLPRAVGQPTGGDWAAHVCLARVAGAISGHGRLSTVVNVETFKPLVDSKPFLEAFGAMAQWEKTRAAGGVAGAYADPEAVFRGLAQGELALGLTWPSVHFMDEAAKSTSQLRVARLPAVAQWFDTGSNQWRAHGGEDQRAVDYLGVSGLTAGVSRNSLHASESLNFLAWLCSKRISLQLSTQSKLTGPFRSSQLANPVRWVGESLQPEAVDQYAEAIRQTHADRLIMTFPKMPGQRQYLAALASAASKAAEGSLTPEQAAAEAVSDFNRLTESLGGAARQSRLLREAEGY